ncbi:MAG: cytochrome c4 [Gammaproteobacteria bacterium]|nr:cytochrome c4 [Gammaproteobacteria bacterium]
MFGSTVRSLLISSLGFLLAAPVLAQDAKTKVATCMACHGPDGNSVNPEWPSLAGQHVSYLVAQLQAYKSGARKNVNMNAMVAGLSDQDMADIAGYFSAQPIQVASIDATAAAAGAGLYRGGNAATGVPACMACHGPGGAGNPSALVPAMRGQHAKYTTLQLAAYKSGERATDRAAIMRTIAGRLSDEETAAVAAFIEGLH